MNKADRQSIRITEELIPLILERAELQARIRNIHARQDQIDIAMVRILSELGQSPGRSVTVGNLTFQYENPTGVQPWVAIRNQAGEWIGGDALIQALKQIGAQ